MGNQLSLLQNRVEKQLEDVSLERIPTEVYSEMVEVFSDQYHFENGGKMRISDYYVKVSRSLSDAFVGFIDEINEGLSSGQFPKLPAPLGFQPGHETLHEAEIQGGYSLGSFDMAVSESGLQNIEFQAVATYPVSAAKLNQFLLDKVGKANEFVFADSPDTNWDDFTHLYRDLIAGGHSEGIVLVDRKIEEQKTNFEFFATQKELNVPIEIVDIKDIFEKQATLYYSTPNNPSPVQITRFYNRLLLADALFEEGYPGKDTTWKFRFDKNYDSLTFINHPIRQFEVSKRLSPHIQHPYNPDCFQLSEVVQDFQSGKLKYEDYVWKHKWGAAGHKLVLEPDAEFLEDSADDLEDYIAQRKVNFKIFKTDDGKEKIVELRFMTAIHNAKMIIVPMARIGHVEMSDTGNTIYKIHFGDNNEEGYGFSPVIIVDE